MKPLPPRAIATAKLLRAAPSVPSRRPPATIQSRRVPEREQHGAPDAHGESDRDADGELEQRASSARKWSCPRNAELARGDSQRERRRRCDDAVVEAALHVEHAAHPHGYPLVVDHLGAQRSVGRRQRRPHEAGERPRRSSRSHAASSDPRTTDSGSPMPRSRAGNPASRLSSGCSPWRHRRTAAARASAPRSGGSRVPRNPPVSGPQFGFASTNPATMKTIGPSMFARASTPEVTAHPRTSNARTANVPSVTRPPPRTSVQVSPPELHRSRGRR